MKRDKTKSKVDPIDANPKNNILSNNAFYTLGLSSLASQKEIMRRSKEINARLKIDDIPNYDGDIAFLEPHRSIDLIKKSVHELSQPKARLHHHFFWFTLDEESAKLIASNDFNSALNLWSKTNNDKMTTFYNSKNAALLKTILLYQQADTASTQDAIDVWKKLIGNKGLWKAFEKKYLAEDEVGCSPQIFKEFSEETVGILSDIFTEISNFHSNPSIYKAFSDTFSFTGQKVVSDVLTPIFEKMDDISEKLESLDVSEDGILDDDEKLTIADCLSKIRQQISEIEKLGLEEDSSARSVRDRVADAVRTVVLDIYNNLEEMDYAEMVLRKALEIAGTEGEKERINQDLRVIQGVQKHTEILTPLLDLLKTKQDKEAIRLIENLESECSDDAGLLQTLAVKKKECILLEAGKLKNEGMEHFGEGHYTSSATAFNSAFELLDKYMNLFDLDEDYVRNDILGQVRKNIEVTTADNIAQVEEIRNKDVEQFQELFDTRYEGYYLIIIYDSLFYGGIAGKATKLKGQATRRKWTNQLIGWGIFIAIIAALRSCYG